jgi:hypothetical protein
MDNTIEEKMDDCKADGDDSGLAKAKAVNYFVPEIRKELKQKYVNLILSFDRLMNDPLHREIMKTIKHFKTAYGMTLEEAVKQVVKLRKHLINENLMPEHDEEDVHDSNKIY